MKSCGFVNRLNTLEKVCFLLESHLDVIGSTMQRNKNYQPLSEKECIYYIKRLTHQTTNDR